MAAALLLPTPTPTKPLGMKVQGRTRVRKTQRRGKENRCEGRLGSANLLTSLRVALVAAMLLFLSAAAGAQSIAFVSVTPHNPIAPGSYGIVDIKIARTNYSGTVTFVCSSGLPYGVTCPAKATNTTVTQLQINVPTNVELGTFTVGVRASGSGIASVTSSFTLTIQKPPGIQSLSLSPGTITINPGGSGRITATIVRESGFTGSVTLALMSSLPSGVTASITNPGTGNTGYIDLTAGTSCQLVSGAVIRVQAQSTSAAAVENTFSLTTAKPPGIRSLSLSPGTITINPGGSGRITATIVRESGFTGSVTLALTSSLPSGVTASITNPGTGNTGYIDLTAAVSCQLVTNASIRVQAQSTSAAAVENTFSLTTAKPPGIRSLSLSPGTITINPGGSGRITATIVRESGFTGSVTLALMSSLPSGVTASITNPGTGNTGYIDLTAGASCQLVTNASIRVQAQSTSAAAVENTFSLTTAKPPGIRSLSLSPGTITINPGGSGRITATIVRESGFTGSVTLALMSSLPSGVTASITNPGTGNTGYIDLTAGASCQLVTNASIRVQAQSTSAAAVESTFSLTTAKPPGIQSLSLSPGTITINPGGSGRITATIVRESGFTGSVTLALMSSLPSGVTASITNPGTGNTGYIDLTAGTSCQLVSGAVIRVQAQSTSAAAVESTFSLTTAKPPGIQSLSLSPGTITINPGGSGRITATIVRESGFTGSVTLALMSSLPSGVTASITNPGTGNTGYIDLTAAVSCQLVTNASIRVQAQSTSAAAVENTFLLNTTPGPGIASVSLNPASTDVARGGATSVNVGIVREAGFAGAVSIAASNLPEGVYATYSQPVTGNLGGINLSADANAGVVSNHLVTITASAAGVAAKSAALTLSVTTEVIRPDLIPAALAGWAGPLVVASAPGSFADSGVVAGGQAYLRYAVKNQGSAPVASTFVVEIWDDTTSQLIDRRVHPSLPAGAISTAENIPWTFHTGGVHTLRLRVDADNLIDEGPNELNNDYIRTITVTDWQDVGEQLAAEFVRAFETMDQKTIVASYANGKKHLVSFGWDVCPAPLCELKGTLVLDLDDWARVTKEGQDDWITFWVDLETGFSQGLNPIPFGVSFEAMRRELNVDDPLRRFDLTLLSSGFATAKAKLLTFNASGIEAGSLTWEPASDFAEVGALQTTWNLVRGEMQRSVLLEAVRNAALASGFGPFANFPNLAKGIMESLFFVDGGGHLQGPKQPSRFRAFSSSDNPIENSASHLAIRRVEGGVDVDGDGWRDNYVPKGGPGPEPATYYPLTIFVLSDDWLQMDLFVEASVPDGSGWFVSALDAEGRPAGERYDIVDAVPWTSYGTLWQIGSLDSATSEVSIEFKLYRNRWPLTNVLLDTVTVAFSSNVPDPGPATATIVPSSHEFGGVQVGTYSQVWLALTNTGSTTLSGQASTTAPFSIDAGGTYSLSAGQSQQVQVRFAPTGSGAFSGSLVFSGGGGARVSLSGSGVSNPTPAIGVTPGGVDFGAVPFGSFLDKTFVVTNTGGGTLDGAAMVPSPFSIVSGQSYVLGSGESANVVVRFSPTGVQTFTGNLTFTGAGGFCAAVYGSGFDAIPVIAVNPSSVDFGVVQNGGYADRTLLVRNVGGGRLVGSATVAPPFTIVSGGGYELDSGQGQPVVVRFSPVVAGDHSAAMSFGGGGGAVVSLFGQGTSVQTPRIAVSPGQVGFGMVVLGSVADEVITVQNTGGGILAGTASTLLPFTIVSGANYNLGPGESQQVGIRFSPSSEGSYSEDVTFTGGGEPHVSRRGLASVATLP